MSNYERAIRTLEYEKILTMLSECASTLGARQAILTVFPSDDMVTVRRLQTETAEAKRLVTAKGRPSFGTVRDVRPALERADRGASLSMRELLDVADVLRSARMLLDYSRTEHSFDTVLDEIFERLSTHPRLETQITRSILSEDMMADEASPALADIRRRKKLAVNRIRDTLQKYTGGEYAQYLQENIVTSRNGRYVVPVKNEHRSEIKGLLHDTSASGATVFIEPLAVVEANNEIRALESRERHEMERILAELSAACAAHSGEICLNYDNITALDIIFARAELAFRMDAAAPILTEKRVFSLHHARHPLLDGHAVVPIDIHLGRDFDTLVVTGPNTGGKTVSLKTLGLFALMVQSGLQIPAASTSEVCIFESVLADIGDEQSIEQSLSTFSAHMVNIIAILQKANDRSLVLIDELGAGTDPIEGAALAVSILEAIREKHALCAATTHYAELKEYALQTQGVMNASCEFDVETLRPTYRLMIGTPGRSNAFAISLRLGMPDAIVERARAMTGEGSRHFEEVIDRLERTRMELETEREAAAQRRREYEEYAAAAEKEIQKRLDAAEKEAEHARAQAVRMVESARVSSDFIFAQLNEVKKKQESENFAEALEETRAAVRRRLQETDTVVNPVYEKTNEDYVLPRPLKAGDAVLLVNIGKEGVVLAPPDADGNVSVQAGVIKTRTQLTNLRLLDSGGGKTAADKKGKKTASASYQEALHRTFRPEIDLRGQMTEDAWFMVDKYLDDAKMASVQSVTLIHGKGTGALKRSLWQNLKYDSRVASYRIGNYGEGDSGVTVVELK